MKRMVLAVGGNSLIRAGEKGTVHEEIANARRIAAQIIGLIRLGYRIVLTHGNGPQVGAELLSHERTTNQASAYPLDVCDAATQGEIGYLLQQALDNEAEARRFACASRYAGDSVRRFNGRSLHEPSNQAYWPLLLACGGRGAQATLRMGTHRRCGSWLPPRGAIAGTGRDHRTRHHS